MKKYIVAALSFALASCLSGCGSSSSSSSTTSAAPPATTSAAESAAAEATSEDVTAGAENASGAVTKDENGYTHYPTPEDVTDFTGVDFSAPSIKVSFGDYDKMFETSKAIQNYQLEGVVVETDGILKNNMSHSIQMPNADNSQSIGTTIQVVGLDDKDFPENDTKIHIVGIVRPLNEYAHGIFVAKENFKVVE